MRYKGLVRLAQDRNQWRIMTTHLIKEDKFDDDDDDDDDDEEEIMFNLFKLFINLTFAEWGVVDGAREDCFIPHTP